MNCFVAVFVIVVVVVVFVVVVVSDVGWLTAQIIQLNELFMETKWISFFSFNTYTRLKERDENIDSQSFHRTKMQ